MAQWSRALAAPVEDWSLISASPVNPLQTTVTLAPGDLMPSLAFIAHHTPGVTHLVG